MGEWGRGNISHDVKWRHNMQTADERGINYWWLAKTGYISQLERAPLFRSSWSHMDLPSLSLPPFSLFLSLSVCLSLYLYSCPSLSLSLFLSLCMSLCLFLSLPVSLSLSLSLTPLLYLSWFLSSDFYTSFRTTLLSNHLIIISYNKHVSYLSTDMPLFHMIVFFLCLLL